MNSKISGILALSPSDQSVSDRQTQLTGKVQKRFSSSILCTVAEKERPQWKGLTGQVFGLWRARHRKICLGCLAPIPDRNGKSARGETPGTSPERRSKRAQVGDRRTQQQ